MSSERDKDRRSQVEFLRRGNTEGIDIVPAEEVGD